MRLNYDFHIHSCLSPCGDADMTPYNLVNMAKILGLDVIALTDHNSTGNCKSAVEAGKDAGLTVIAGMELCTAEEIHIVCLFPGLEAAGAFGEIVSSRIPPIKNKANIYGRQLYMDSQDKILGEEEVLLVTASMIGIDEVRGLVENSGGFCYPAHIDRASFSIISSLGSFPPDLGFTCAEASPNADIGKLTADYPELGNVRIMRSSDSHYLENMHEAGDFIDVPECTAKAIISYLRSLN